MIKLIYRLLFLLVAGLWSFTVASADQATAYIDLEQETRKEVVIAVPEFKLKGGLKLSELSCLTESNFQKFQMA